MKPFFLVLTVLLISLNVTSQQDVMTFRNLTTDKGLSHGDIFCFYRDHEGYIWIGTTDGLNRYDGVGFTVYKFNLEDKTSLSSSYISCIYEDKRNNLWIGVLNGLCRYNRDHNNFERIDYPYDQGEKFSHHVQEIFEDQANNLWIGTENGIFRLDREGKRLTTCFNDHCHKEELATCNDIVEDKKGNLWFALFGSYGGLIKYNPHTRAFVKYTAGSQGIRLKENNILSLMVDFQDNIWIGYSSKGIDVISEQGSTIVSYEHHTGHPYSLNSNIIFSMVQAPDNRILISTDGGGIDVLDPVSKKISHNTSTESDFSLLSNTVQDLYLDYNGTLWAGCWGGGVSINDERFNRFGLYKQGKNDFSSLLGTSVTSFTQDEKGNIWVSTDGGGINLFNTKRKNFVHYYNDGKGKQMLTNNKVLALHADAGGGLWAGMWQGGLNYFRIKGQQLVPVKRYDFLDNNDPNSNCVFKIYETASGELWIGNYSSGVYVFDHKTATFKPVRLPLGYTPYNTIRDILCDTHNDMWFATEYNGLIRMDRETGEFEKFIHVENDTNSLINNSINVIFEDSRQRIWVGADDGGLNLFDPVTRSFIRYTTVNGLPDNTVVGILEDQEGDLWISSHVGLTEAKILSSGKRPLIRFRNYDVQDGLQGRVFNRWAYFKSGSGELYFGGLNGFNVFNPDSLRDNTFIPQIHLTDFLLFNKSVTIGSKDSPLKKHISQTKRIELRPNQSFFTFRFIALNYIFSEKNQYAYIMRDFDKDWNYVGNKREATYTNLNPGQYTFTVKASNNDGIWNEEGVSVDVVILPPWWKTWWFNILFAAFIVAALVGFYINRTNRFRNNQIILENMVQNRTSELKAINKALEEKQKEINLQKEELELQRNSLQEANSILLDQQKRIVDQNTELDKHRFELESLISERTRELEDAKKRAEESDRLKSAFLANMSHEIRTPMNAIVGFSGLLNDPSTSEEERREFVSHIHSNSDSLLMLINDILDLSLIEANQIHIHREPFLLNEFVDQIFSVHSLHNKNPELRLVLNNKLKSQNLKLKTDKYRLNQILTNFMSNACKFTASGSVELGVVKAGDRLNLYVKDTGIGIPEKDVVHMFERFRKLNEDHSNPARGAGLGLAISKRLAELLGGDIEVNSAPEKGSVFTFTVPYSTVVTHVEITQPPAPKIFNNADWTGRSILIVEDEEANYFYLSRILEKTHAAITWASNGLEAVSLCQSGTSFDLILMDIKMPEMNGIEALKKLREMDPHLLIIAQTAYARTEDETMLRKEGFDDYISKPISPANLLVLLDKYLG